MGKPYVAFLWHHHQPPYADPAASAPAFALPWVRLHAARDYYQMGELARRFPALRLTFNFTPVLLDQLRAYAEGGIRDRLMELSLRDYARLTPRETDHLIARSFDVHFQNQIKKHPRYLKLFRKYNRREGFSAADVRDAVALFNLAWVGDVFRDGPVELETGVTVDFRELAGKGYGYTAADVDDIFSLQLNILKAVVPLHRSLQDAGQIEVSTTPYYHPILPILHDSDQARIDRPGSRHPRRFSRPKDAREQVRRAVATYERDFGRAPYGMWPAEGAVSEAAVSYFRDAGINWIATDEGVLALSGGSGYDVSRPEILLRPYRAGEDGPTIFFRHRGLSDAIGFVYQNWRDHDAAAADFAKQLHMLVSVARSRTVRDVVLTVALDGENAWGAYHRTGVPFLTALYSRVAAGAVARPVTFREYLEGASARDISPHPAASLDAVAGLACASWIDEAGSSFGNDLGTWIGEPEENAAWELLGVAGATLDRSRAPRAAKDKAREYLLAAEASDWFWWYGDDQGGGADEEFDRLFRANLRRVYEELGAAAPPGVNEPIAPRRIIWKRDAAFRIRPGDLLVVEWPDPGEVRFGVNGWQCPEHRTLIPSHGVMGPRKGVYRAPLLRIVPGVRRVEFTFRGEDGTWLGYDFFVPVNEDLL